MLKDILVYIFVGTFIACFLFMIFEVVMIRMKMKDLTQVIKGHHRIIAQQVTVSKALSEMHHPRAEFKLRPKKKKTRRRKNR